MVDTYVDLEILAEVADDDYLIRISKEDLNTLVSFGTDLNMRHWNGKQPVLLEEYGKTSVRTKGDSTESNNLSQLPKAEEHRLTVFLQNL